MFEMLINATRLFIAGRLFRDNRLFFRQWGMGFGSSLALMAGLGWLNPWLGMVVGGAVGGALLPWLFRDLKYR